MCVKEFYGYQCGHCSVPVLRRCPLSASNPMYPVCEYPAERPIFVAEFCHPCSRVVWNAKVLAEEEKHRQRHFRSECDCEVTFAGEDPERRGRARARGRDKGKEFTNGEVVLYEGGYDDDGSTGGRGFESEEAQGPLVVPSEPKDHGGEKLARNGSDAYTYYGIYMEEGFEGSAGLVGPMVPIGPLEMADPNQSYATAVGEYGTPGGQQLMMGQFGAGMKFYPAPVNLPPPPPMEFRSPTASMAYSQYDHYQHYGPAHTHQRRIHGHRSHRQRRRPLSRSNSVPATEPDGFTSGSSRPRQVSDVGQD